MFSEVRKRAQKAGQPPGTAIYTGEKSDSQPLVTCVQYNGSDISEKTGNQLKDCLTEQKPGMNTWVNVEGLHNASLIEETRNHFNLHPLTIEDILNIEQRPKVEEFDHYLFVTMKILEWLPKSFSFSINQLSLIIGKDYVLSFHEEKSSRFNEIRKRLLSTPNQRLRQQGSDYLAYRIIDAVVDQYFVVLEGLGDQIEDIEQRIITSPTPQNARTV